mmetsp:Transcript_10855/g.12210  ORF Transcript_10855/g.12210 Transcript_10855/m.12210 type:complete len:82 (-) Transcript_10855:3-248(-)
MEKEESIPQEKEEEDKNSNEDQAAASLIKKKTLTRRGKSELFESKNDKPMHSKDLFKKVLRKVKLSEAKSKPLHFMIAISK